MSLEHSNPIGGKEIAVAGGCIIVVLAFLCIIFTIANAGTEPVAPATAPTPIESTDCVIEAEAATVMRVIDGDTFEADLNGETVTVRLIGVDTPESVNPDESKNTQEGVDASNHTKEILPEGTTVWLQADQSDTDKYGRLLRYVWLIDPCLNEAGVNDMLNTRLVAEGLAIPMRIEPDTAYADLIQQIYDELMAGVSAAAESDPSFDIDPDVTIPDIDIQTPETQQYNNQDIEQRDPETYSFL